MSLYIEKESIIPPGCILNDPSAHSERDLVQLSKNALEQEGYFLIKNFIEQHGEIEVARKKFLSISEQIGTPVSHDMNNSIIWDIKSNPKSNSFIKTYSEHNHQAELHTDSQYSFYPEDFFGLLTLQPAECGGGASYLLSLKDVLGELRSRSEGLSAEKTLRETDFPFVVPNVFKKNGNEEREFNFGPILRDNEIRFRVDTFEKAVMARPDLCTDEQMAAYYLLKSIILNSPSIKKFYLEACDLIWINNKTMLHGRSSFTDAKRHLLRIRLNKMN